jgi:hypothetical protein
MLLVDECPVPQRQAEACRTREVAMKKSSPDYGSCGSQLQPWQPDADLDEIDLLQESSVPGWYRLRRWM